MSLKRPHSPSPPPTPTGGSTRSLYRSGNITDRSSTFTAVFSPTHTPTQLQSLADFQTASHRISAWRRPSSQRTLLPSRQHSSSTTTTTTTTTVLDTGHDDDGEQYAGKRVERVLTDCGVEGVLVVARWYGGVLLGPVRFTHIENVAREAVEAWRKEQAAAGEVKRRKVADERERERLLRILPERDTSVEVLRALLAEKSAGGRRERGNIAGSTVSGSQDDDDGAGGGAKKQSASSASVTASPKKPPVDYASMPLVRLRQLEKAKDASIAWILKGIDAAEAKAEKMTAETTRETESLE